MESEISHIFENNDQGQQRPPSPAHSIPNPPAPQSESTPLEYVQDQEPPYQHHHQMQPPPMQQAPPYYYQQPPPPAPAPPVIQQWEPFKNISTSTWIILLVAFAMGFFLGKFK